MAVKVEFLFDFGSPNAYLCHLVLPALEKRCDILSAGQYFGGWGHNADRCGPGYVTGGLLNAAFSSTGPPMFGAPPWKSWLDTTPGAVDWAPLF